MSALEALAAGSLGPYLAMAAMALVTFACRSMGYLLMSRIRVTPAITRALAALPGSIVVAIVVPAAMHSGPPALAGVAASLALMALIGSEIVALAGGLVAVTILRAAGL